MAVALKTNLAEMVLAEAAEPIEGRTGPEAAAEATLSRKPVVSLVRAAGAATFEAVPTDGAAEGWQIAGAASTAASVQEELPVVVAVLVADEG